MKKIFFHLFLTVSLPFASMSQAGWNWPENEALKSKAIEKEAFYKVLLSEKKYEEALAPLNWLYENNPNLNQSIYINGVKCLTSVIKQEEDKERIVRLQDSVMWLFDLRLAHFDNDAAIMDRKAYEAFKLYYRTPSRYPFLEELFAKAYDLNGGDISTFNMNPYMMVATRLYKADKEKMPAERVLEIHTQISDVIDYQLKNGGKQEKLKKEQDKVDAFLSSLDDVLNCTFIEEQLVPKFRANPSDLGTAKKIFKYSVQAKCTDQPYFLEASETVYESQPGFELARIMGNKFIANNDIEKAVQYFDEAIKLAANGEEKSQALLGKATAEKKRGRKASARKYALEAIGSKSSNPEAYTLIGNLYFTSFDQCKEEKSRVQDRGVFLAAYKMYQLAGNTSQMKAAKEQFPSIEDIFNENLEEGSNITVGCWINEKVEVLRRPNS